MRGGVEEREAKQLGGEEGLLGAVIGDVLRSAAAHVQRRGGGPRRVRRGADALPDVLRVRVDPETTRGAEAEGGTPQTVGLGLAAGLGEPPREGAEVGDARSLRVARRLPLQRPTPLANLAADVLGDSHGLDHGKPVHALVLRYLAPVTGVAGWESRDARREAWSHVGVIVDELSAPALVLGLRARGDSFTAHTLRLHADAHEPCRLSTRQLLREPHTRSPQRDHYGATYGPTATALAVAPRGPITMADLWGPTPGLQPPPACQATPISQADAARRPGHPTVSRRAIDGWRVNVTCASDQATRRVTAILIACRVSNPGAASPSGDARPGWSQTRPKVAGQPGVARSAGHIRKV